MKTGGDAEIRHEQRDTMQLGRDAIRASIGPPARSLRFLHIYSDLSEYLSTHMFSSPMVITIQKSSPVFRVRTDGPSFSRHAVLPLQPLQVVNARSEN